MANRSYLYALNGVPALNVPIDALEVTGISEFNYSIPLVYRLLVSSDPMACQSLIWGEAGQIGIIGSYGGGVERLRTFLQRLEHPVAAPLVSATLDFLALEGNRRSHFLLEAGEIFEMSDEPLQLQNEELLAEIAQLDPTLEPLPVFSDAKKPTSWIGRLLAPPPEALERPLLEIGLGYWSNVLYFDFDQTEGS